MIRVQTFRFNRLSSQRNCLMCYKKTITESRQVVKREKRGKISAPIKKKFAPESNVNRRKAGKIYEEIVRIEKNS